MHFPKDESYWISFHMLICHLYNFFGEISVHISCWILWVLWIFWYNSVIRYVFCTYFLPVCDLSPDIVFLRAEVLILMTLINVSFFSSMDHNFNVVSVNSSPNPRSHRFPPMLSSSSLLLLLLLVFHITLRSIICYELILI